MNLNIPYLYYNFPDPLPIRQDTGLTGVLLKIGL